MIRFSILSGPAMLAGFLLTAALAFIHVPVAQASLTCNVPMGITDICIGDVFSFVDEISPNINGYTIGTNISIGGEIAPNPGSVPPSPTTVVDATQGTTNVVIPFTGNPAFPNDYFKQVPFSPNLTGSWTIAVTDPTGTLSVPTQAIGSTAPLPFVQSMSLVPGAIPTQPTFSWTIPSGAATNTSVFIFRDFQNGGQLICAREGLPLTTSFAVPSTSSANCPVPVGGLLLPGANYSVAIELDQFRTPAAPFQSPLVSRSRSFFDFTLPNAGAPIVSLPTVGPDGVYRFNTVVTAGKTIFIDPPLAIGYDYRTGLGNPNFASVTFPTGLGSGTGGNTYALSVLGPSGQPIGPGFDATGGLPFDFLTNGYSSGVDAFEVLGIPTSANLDPSNTTAFITGLTFTADGVFTGTMTPIVTPEPTTLAMLGSGLLGLGWFQRRRNGGRFHRTQ